MISFSPVFMMEYGVWRHWHVVMSNIKLVLSIILSPLMHVESHSCNVILRNIHIFGSLFVLWGELLPNVWYVIVLSLAIHSLVLSKWATSEISLIHLHWVHLLSVWSNHSSTAVIWSCTSIGHATNKALALQTHAHCLHLVHLLEVNTVHGLERIHLLVDHVIDADLRLSSTLLWGHWQVVRLIHRVLILRFLWVQPVVLCVWILHYLVHLDFVSYAWWRVWVLKVVESLLVRILLMDVVLWSSRSLTSRIRIDATDTLTLVVNTLSGRTKVIIYRHLSLSSSWFCSVLLWYVNCTSTMTSLADSTSFCWLCSCSCIVSFERSLGMNWS